MDLSKIADLAKVVDPSLAAQVNIPTVQSGIKTAEDKQQDTEKRMEEQTSLKAAGAMKKGGKVKAKSASKRADGIAQRGKTKGKYL